MRAIQVYNTLTRRKEPLDTREPGVVAMYVCGVTPYSSCHLGHARCYVAYDVIRRYLEYCGYRVRHIQNFTDVDDKIIARGRELGQDPLTLARALIAEYFRDMDALGILRADVYPKVSEHIPEVVAMVQGLVEKGFAYPVDSVDVADAQDVLLEVARIPSYGQLSRRSLDEQIAGARVERDERKRDPRDFFLWKSAKPGEPAWESPWGPGRPGWHIECSAMSLKYLGPDYDIHGGGPDLIFPHHENEIAQSEAYTGQRYVRYWVHNGQLNIRGEKMAKSEGNDLSIQAVLARYSPEAIRMYFLQTRYNNPLNLDVQATAGQVEWPQLEEAARALDRLYTARHTLDRWLSGPSEEGLTSEATWALQAQAEETRTRFHEAMSDDFNTAAALGAIFELVATVHRCVSQGDFRGTPEARVVLRDVQQTIQELGQVLGLFQRPLTAPDESETEALLDLLIHVRQQARERRDWATADMIRDRLARLGFAVEDHPEKTTWRRIQK